jgi:hypothetical protein
MPLIQADLRGYGQIPIFPFRVKQRGVDLVLVADGRDRLAVNQMEFEQPDFLLGGILAARAGGLVVFRIHGLVRLPGHSLPQRVNSDVPSGAGQKFAAFHAGMKICTREQISPKAAQPQRGIVVT